MRTYWILSHVAVALATATAVVARLHAEAHPAQTGAASWGQARLALLGFALAAALALHAVATDVVVVIQGLARPVVAGVLAAGALAGAAAVAWLAGR